MSETTLWRQFNLRGNNPSPGGGILMCLRCSREEIESRYPSLVSAIENMGVFLEDRGKTIAVTPQDPLSDACMANLMQLLGELSVLNEAIEYQQAGYAAFHSIKELREGMVVQFFELLSHGNKYDAYDLVSCAIPQIVRDIRVTHEKFKTLSPHEVVELEQLFSFASRKERQLNKGLAVIGHVSCMNP